MQNKFLVMDQGGEMDRNPAIVSLFDKHGYLVKRIAKYAPNKILKLKSLTDTYDNQSGS